MKRTKKSKFDFTMFAGSVGGAIVARIVTSKLPIKNAMVKNLVPVGLGAFLMNNKNPMLQAAGSGMVAAGGAGLVTSFIPGISGLMTDVVNGVGADDMLIEGVGAEDAAFMIDGVGAETLDVNFNSRIAGNTDVINGGDEFIAGAEEFMA
jgi:hypothetical protein